MSILSKASNIIQRVARAMHPSSTELGIKNPATGSGVHVRDDMTVEIQAGSASILVDGRSGVITFTGKAINHSAQTVKHSIRADGFRIADARLNPYWIPTPVTAFAKDLRSPLVALTGGLDMPLITGAPAQGQTTTSLRKLIKGQELFNYIDPYRAATRNVRRVVEKFESVV